MRFMAWKEVRTMIFSELYGVYYKTVASILKAAVDHPLQENEINQIVEKNAFGESMLTIPAALKEEKWQLLRGDGTTPLNHAPTIPLTLLQKRWLKAIMHDPRIQLFTDEPLDFPDVEPLFFDDLHVYLQRYLMIILVDLVDQFHQLIDNQSYFHFQHEFQPLVCFVYDPKLIKFHFQQIHLLEE